MYLSTLKKIASFNSARVILLVLFLFSVTGCGYFKQGRDIRYAKRVIAKKQKDEEELKKVRGKLRRIIDYKIRAVNMLETVDRLLARRYMENGSYLLALEPLKEAEALKPNNAFIKKDLGECYYFLAISEVDDVKRDEYLKRSKKYLDKALDIDPGLTEARYVLSLLLFFGYNDVDGAIKEALKIVKQDPKNVDAHFALGRFYYEKGELGRALNEYIKITNILPKNSPKRKKAEENIIRINREMGG